MGRIFTNINSFKSRQRGRRRWWRRRYGWFPGLPYMYYFKQLTLYIFYINIYIFNRNHTDLLLMLSYFTLILVMLVNSKGKFAVVSDTVYHSLEPNRSHVTGWCTSEVCCMGIWRFMMSHWLPASVPALQ